MNNTDEHTNKIQKFLEKIIEGDYSQIIVHEAVEALGNLNDANTQALIDKYRGSGKDISEMVVETCELA